MNTVCCVTGSVCLDYIHSIKKLESDPDLAIQVQVSPSDAHSVKFWVLFDKIYICLLSSLRIKYVVYNLTVRLVTAAYIMTDSDWNFKVIIYSLYHDTIEVRYREVRNTKAVT